MQFPRNFYSDSQNFIRKTQVRVINNYFFLYFQPTLRGEGLRQRVDKKIQIVARKQLQHSNIKVLEHS